MSVYPVNNIDFTIGTKGVESEEADFKIIKEMITFSIAPDNNIQEWNPMEAKGWMRRLMTGKSITITLEGKRNYGDAGNDYIAGIIGKNGNDASTIMKVVYPDKSGVTMQGVINPTARGGASTDVEELSFEFMSDGEPTFIPKPTP